ncbi:MAG: SPOR domain-containing protein [Nitrospirota bacterium]
MKKTDFKEKSSAFIIGRGLIITVIIVTSSLSFILGYLVGKSSTKENLQDMNAPPIEARFQTETVKAQKEATRDSHQPRKSAKIVYTVQVGAFKDASDAEALKTRLDKKGYKANVTPSGSKRKARLYKVWIGEFSNRKEAEMLSMKIKKAEGLQTFITFKTGQESIRQP